MASKDDNRRGRLERRVFNLTNAEVRMPEDGATGPAVFSGYAAVFNELSVDLGGFREQIKPGAFRAAIEGGDDVRFLINHNADKILGRTPKTLTLSEDERGLMVECELPNTSYANDLAESMRRGDITQMSFGFTTRADSWPSKDAESGLPIRQLEDVGLFDVSAVAYPAYPDTTAEVRSLIEEEHPEILERAQRAAEELLADEIVLDHAHTEDAERDTAEDLADEIDADAAESFSYENDPEWRDTWTTAYKNNLPDSAFLYVEDGDKDADGKTTPRTKRHFPYKDASGKVDLPHLRDALGRIPQSDLSDSVKTEVEAKAKKILEASRDAAEADETTDNQPAETDEHAGLREEYEQLRSEAGVRIEEGYDGCMDGVAVVWNWNDEIQSCHIGDDARQCAQDQVDALTSGAAGAAREEPSVTISINAELSDETKEALELLQTVMADSQSAIEKLTAASVDARVGKTLSKENADKLSQAHELLHAVLSMAGESDPGFDDGTGGPSTEPDEMVTSGYASEGDRFEKERRRLRLREIEASL